jgi:hypothetical protein
MHYFRTSVKWCKFYQSRSSTLDGNPITPDGSGSCGRPNGCYEGTLYLGSASPQDCKYESDFETDPALKKSDYKYPYYYFPHGEKYSTKRDDHTQHPSFELVVLNYSTGAVNGTSSIAHTFIDENGDLKNGHMHAFVDFNDEINAYDHKYGIVKTKHLPSRTAAEELENYANWYTYYSNRTAATRTVATFALVGIEPDRWLRMWFATVNESLNIGALVESRKIKNEHGKYVVDGFKTIFPIYKAVLEHNVTGNRGTPLKTAMDRVRQKFASDEDFIIHSCQRNYVVALSDGVWNDDFSGVGNQDLTVRSMPPKAARVLGVDLASGVLWPRPIREGGLARNTLSDISLYAWLNELRPAGNRQFDVDQTVNDPASWGHLNTIALTYAAGGTLPTKSLKDTLAQITSGARDWPVPAKNAPEAVDDLWHAAISGFGVFTTGVAPQAFNLAIDSGHGGMTGFDNIGRGGTFAALGLPISRDLGDINEMFGYSASFTPNWGGTITKVKILDAALLTEGAAAWDAELKLAAKMASPANAWETKREIFTGKDGSTIPFTFAGLLGSGYLQWLGADTDEQRDVIAYIRGDTSLEKSSTGIGKYRKRSGILGDFVHASPAVFDPPVFRYDDDKKNPGYRAFRNKQSSQGKMIYAAGNGGMLHAFDDNGEEQWAFIPPELFRSAGERGIINLSRDEDDRWKHYFYVDSTPRIIDANLGSLVVPDWRTMLIGGMGKGGVSYYALDITEGGKAPTSSPFYKWTFTDKNMGYTYGRALIVKVKTEDWDERWVAILPSGLNNGAGDDQLKQGDGVGRIFFVDLATGEKLHEIVTRDEGGNLIGTPTEPSGLAYIRAFVEGPENQLADAVYGGDQLGNFWRFDLASDKMSEWKAVRLAILSNEDKTLLPVNTEPRMEVVAENDVRWVMVGTGRHYVEGDFYDWVAQDYPKNTQGMFAFKDGTGSAPEPDLSKFPYGFSDLNKVTDALGGLAVSSEEKGWAHFFAEGYQIITNPDSLYEQVVYVANRYVPAGQEGLDICETSPFEADIFERRADGVLLAKGHFKGGLSSASYIYFLRNGQERYGILLTDLSQNARNAIWRERPRPGRGVVGQPDVRRSSIRFINR